jgi:hypothetical protein
MSFFFFKLFFIISILYNIIICENSDENCNEFIEYFSEKEEDLAKYISNKIHKLKNKSQQCIDILVKNGKLLALDFYLTELGKRGVSYRENLEMSINTLKKALDDIHNKHRFDQIQYQTVFPAFQWAQSLNEIFLEIKFAHRHDSPGCLEIKDLSVKFGSNSVDLIGYCVLGDVPIKIDFHIKTWAEISKENSTHGFGSVGRYQITLKKKEAGKYWNRLLADGQSIPNNMRVWFEMKEKFEESLKEFEKDDDDEEFNKELEEMKKKKAEGKKKNKEKKHHKKDADL